MGASPSREKRRRSPVHPVLSHPLMGGAVAAYLVAQDMMSLRQTSRATAAVIDAHIRDELLKSTLAAYLPLSAAPRLPSPSSSSFRPPSSPPPTSTPPPPTSPRAMKTASTTTPMSRYVKLSRLLSPLLKTSFYCDLCSVVDPQAPLACSRLILSTHWADGLAVVGDATRDGIGCLIGREEDTKRSKESELRIISMTRGIRNDLFHGNVFLVRVDLSALCDVRSIGDNCLSGCTNLQSVDLSGLHRLQTIGHNFLRSASQLRALDFSALGCLEEVGHHFLAYCYNLSRLDLRPLRKLSRVGDDALDGCANALHYLRQQGDWVEVPTGTRSKRFSRHWDPVGSEQHLQGALQR